MKRFILFIFLLISFTCSNYEDPKELILYSYEYRADGFDLQLFNDVNTYRVQQGLNALILNDHISYICSTHNDYMIENNRFDHSYVQYRFDNIISVLGATRVGEILAYNYQTSLSTLNAWSNSPAHKEIIQGEYTHMGLSVTEDSFNRKYVTLILAKI